MLKQILRFIYTLPPISVKLKQITMYQPSRFYQHFPLKRQKYEDSAQKLSFLWYTRTIKLHLGCTFTCSKLQWEKSIANLFTCLIQLIFFIKELMC